MDLDSSAPTCGEAQVTDAETKGSTLSQHTTYLVKVKLGVESFESRKRYSDFEWLRTTLGAHFPGILIPPLPRKQKIGRFEEAFIETRRAGLQDFLRSLLRRRQLCIESPTLKKFLKTTTEEAMEELKKEYENRAVSVRFEQYKEALSLNLEGAKMPSDERIWPCKSFLGAHTAHLRELAASLKELVDAQQSVEKAVAATQKKLVAIGNGESDAFATLRVGEQPRQQLVEGFRRQSAALEAAPALHYDLLLAATERELLEAEAMQEALDSVDGLQKEIQEAESKVDNLTAVLKRVAEGGDIPSTGTGLGRMFGMAPKMGREERIGQMKADLEQKKKDVVITKEFYIAARIVLHGQEIDHYYNEKVVGHRRTNQAFAVQSQRTAERIASIWVDQGVRAPIASSGGYAAAVPVALATPEPEQWE